MKAAFSPFPAAEIRADSAYPLDEFARVTGLGEAAIRAARRRGLLVRRCGRNSFVLGSDWLDYLKNHAEVVR